MSISKPCPRTDSDPNFRYGILGMRAFGGSWGSVIPSETPKDVVASNVNTGVISVPWVIVDEPDPAQLGVLNRFQ